MSCHGVRTVTIRYTPDDISVYSGDYSFTERDVKYFRFLP